MSEHVLKSGFWQGSSLAPSHALPLCLTCSLDFVSSLLDNSGRRESRRRGVREHSIRQCGACHHVGMSSTATHTLQPPRRRTISTKGFKRKKEYKNSFQKGLKKKRRNKIQQNLRVSIVKKEAFDRKTRNFVIPAFLYSAIRIQNILRSEYKKARKPRGVVLSR